MNIVITTEIIQGTKDPKTANDRARTSRERNNYKENSWSNVFYLTIDNRPKEIVKSIR